MLRVWKLVARIPEISCQRIGCLADVVNIGASQWIEWRREIASLLISKSAFLAGSLLRKARAKKKTSQSQMISTTLSHQNNITVCNSWHFELKTYDCLWICCCKVILPRKALTTICSKVWMCNPKVLGWVRASDHGTCLKVFLDMPLPSNGAVLLPSAIWYPKMYTHKIPLVRNLYQFCPKFFFFCLSAWFQI